MFDHLTDNERAILHAALDYLKDCYVFNHEPVEADLERMVEASKPKGGRG